MCETNSTDSAMLYAMSSVSNSCLISSLFHSVTGKFCGFGTSSAVTRYGPIGQKVSRDFIW